LRSINEGRLGVDARLRDSLAQMTKGRAIVIDYFASRRCSVVIGDLTGDFRVAPPGRGYVERSSIEGVRVFAASRLLTVLGEADLPRASADHFLPTPRLRPRSPRTLDRLPGRARGAVL